MVKTKEFINAHAADMTDLATVVIAALLSMSGKYFLLPLAILFPVMWLKSQSRLKGGMLAAAYYTVALRDIPAGATVYLGTETLWTGTVIFYALVAVLSGPYFLMWSKSFKKRVFLLAVILFINIIPPLGIVGFANPLFAAGAIFPYAKWFGLVSTLFLIFFMSLPEKKNYAAGLKILSQLGVLLILLATLYFNPEIKWKSVEGWIGVDTNFKFSAGKRPPKREYSRQIELVRKVAEIKQKVIVLPETAFGKWNLAAKKLWQNALKTGRFENKVVIGGGEVWNEKKKGYENAVVQVSPRQKILYRQKIPVPWKFKNIRTAAEQTLENPAFRLKDKKAVPLICYESYILYPFLEAMFFNRNQKPDALVVMGNQWWSENLRFADLQKCFSKSLARLFGLPAIIAVNYPVNQRGKK